MHGFGEGLPISRFVGDDVTQVCIGRNDLQLQFTSAGSMSIWSHWELRDHSGALIDEEIVHENRDAYRVHRILHRPLTRFELDAPRSLTLVFDDELLLTIFDDEPMFEAMSITVKGDPALYIV